VGDHGICLLLCVFVSVCVCVGGFIRQREEREKAASILD